jgi:bacillithiol system protein YtxJ
MTWNELTNKDQLDQLVEESKEQPVLIFKHSTRCSISSTSLGRLERNWKLEEVGAVKPYYLDLISFREISNLISQKFEVEHQSPQILIIENGKAVFDRSHLEIDYASIKNRVLASQKSKVTF